MNAHSGQTGQTGQTYDSWDDLVAAEANGWVVVSVLRRKGLTRERTFARTVGPYENKVAARNRAATLRAKWRRELVDDPTTELLSVNVEPLWKTL